MPASPEPSHPSRNSEHVIGQSDGSWLNQYFEVYVRAFFTADIYDDLVRIGRLWAEAGMVGKKILFAGNGGSAAMASHCSVDLTKTAGIRAVNFNEADLITCFANDYGYSNWLAKAVEFYGDAGDILVLISSSGRSANMLHAADTARQLGITVVTFTGFDADNPLRQRGAVNLWVDSHVYNVVEMAHHIWLLAIIDLEVSRAARAPATTPTPTLSA